MSDYELHKHCIEEYYDGYCDICPYKAECNTFIAKYGKSPLDPDLSDENLCKYEIGDRVCVTELPNTDINGEEYDEIGGGGEIISIDEHHTTIKLLSNACNKYEYDNSQMKLAHGILDTYRLNENRQIQEFVEKALSQLFDLIQYGDLCGEDLCDNMGITEEKMYWMFEQLGYEREE